MNLKNRILNYFADRLKQYRSPEYDYILSCDILGEVKGVFMTTNGSTVKEISDKHEKGLIDVAKLLGEEFDNSYKYHRKEISFCDRDKVVCLYNSKKDGYYESVHEFFESCLERTYIKCESDNSYEAFKRFVLQSSKYHEFIKIKDEIPEKSAFDKVFKENIIKEDNNSKEVNIITPKEKFPIQKLENKNYNIKNKNSKDYER